MSEYQRRFAKCIVCEKEGEVINKDYSQEEIHKKSIEYAGAYIFQRICDECQYKYIENNKEIKVDWNIED